MKNDRAPADGESCSRDERKDNRRLRNLISSQKTIRARGLPLSPASCDSFAEKLLDESKFHRERMAQERPIVASRYGVNQLSKSFV